MKQCPRVRIKPSPLRPDKRGQAVDEAPSRADDRLPPRARTSPSPHLHNELLRLRNFTVRKSVPDSFFTDADGQEKIAEIIRTMVPFVGLPLISACPKRPVPHRTDKHDR